MKKSYKFFNKQFTIMYFILATLLLLIAISFLWIVIVSNGKEQVKAYISITILFVSSIIVYIYASFTIFARFEFDFEKEEIYVLHSCWFSFINKKLRFNSIHNIVICYHTNKIFDIEIYSEYGCNKIAYVMFFQEKNYIKSFYEDLSRLNNCINKNI